MTGGKADDCMTKDAVLAILKKSGDYVSGERISASLGVSRAAVNTAVKSLRAEGYEILSATNRGYALVNAPDRLTAGELLSCLSEERMKRVLCLDSVDSTNRRLREMAYDGAPEGQVVLANEQTGGRGRLGRSFASPRDKGIYFSILLRPEGTPADSVAITAWTAVAVRRAIQTVCGVSPSIKWVNDLVLNGKKLCGILTEMSVESESGRVQSVIVGIGLNVNEIPADFPEEVRQVATSLAAETGKTCARAPLAAEIIRQMDRLRADWPQEKAAYLEAYRTGNLTVGREVCITTANGERHAEAVTIREDFSLAVRYADGRTENLLGGEVSVRGIYGSAASKGTES